MIMGVTGSGKTTVAELIARRQGWEFADADDFHSPSNKQKIRDGIALTDADREPWVQSLHAKIVEWLAQNKNAVLACSALKQSYREEIAVDSAPTVVYLKGSYELIASRLRERHGHFAGVKILASQFATLEEPRDAVTVDISPTPEQIVSEIERRLGLV
ncbi:MAG: gluconokinase [Candidatus Acidiferrales bacterium]